MIGGLGSQIPQLSDVVKDRTSDGLQSDEISSLGKMAETETKQESKKTEKKDVLTQFSKGMTEKYNQSLEKLCEDEPKLQKNLKKTEEGIESMPKEGRQQVVNKSGEEPNESVKQSLEMEDVQFPSKKESQTEEPELDTVIGDHSGEAERANAGQEKRIQESSGKKESPGKQEEADKSQELIEQSQDAEKQEDVELDSKTKKTSVIGDDAGETELVNKGKEKEIDKTDKKESAETSGIQRTNGEVVTESAFQSREQEELASAIKEFKSTGDSSALNTICLSLAQKGNADAMDMFAYTALDKAISKKDMGDLLKIFNMGILPQGISIPKEKLTEMKDKILAMTMEKAIKDPEAIELLTKLKPMAGKEVLMFHHAMEGDVSSMQDLKKSFPDVGEKADKYLKKGHGISG